MMKYVTVLVTAKNKAQARSIAKGLLADKLIACANIVDSVESIFSWKGKIDQSKEVMLVMKTQSKLFKKVALKVKQMHSYETPEIIALPIIMGDQAYLKWIDEAVA